MASSIPVNGYLYTAWGDVHVKEAIASVATLRKRDQEAHVTLVTDRPVHEDPANLTSTVKGQEGAGTLWYHNIVKAAFDRVVVKTNIRRGFAGKVDCMSNEYYTNTFYLDTDTYVCRNPRVLFDLLKHFDLCVSQDPAELDVEMPGLTPYNTGVMLLGPGTSDLLAKFREYYNDEKKLARALEGHPAARQKTDQPSFMLAIRDTKVRVHPLPNVWNARYRFGTSFMGPVNIIHGPVPKGGWESLEQRLNTKAYIDGRLGNRAWEALK